LGFPQRNEKGIDNGKNRRLVGWFESFQASRRRRTHSAQVQAIQSAAGMTGDQLGFMAVNEMLTWPKLSKSFADGNDQPGLPWFSSSHRTNCKRDARFT
jgi:hypothetical protein